MMTGADFRQLIWTSIVNPAEGAEQVAALRPGRDVLWMALVLMAALNTVLLILANFLVPGPWPLPGILANPLVYMGVLAAFLALSAWLLFWVGRLLGGQGSFEDLLGTLIWLQVLRVAVQAASLIVLIVSPLLAGVFGIAAAVYGIYVGLHFVNVAHRFYSLGRAGLALVGAAVALILVLSLLLSVFGIPGMEAAYV
ncbi:Yip1 family protein [Chachezhania sediminis]|uniref:Yip1 family protein n=1 Tax=Chachezhania sediminis TaxID=2599291 RepID=UPI00131DABC5|nr:Yip1 family protein [Chachezhania sediminis]